jgi:hypothetical protein
MLSPDGKWVWDGTQWLAVADPSLAQHHAVFAAWDKVSVEAPVAVEAERPVPVSVAAPVAVPVAEPIAPVFDYATAPQASLTPLWQQQRQTGINKFLYVVAGMVVLVIAATAFNALVPLDSLPWFAGTPSTPTKVAGPAPISVRSDYARAARYVNGFLAPEMSDLSQALQVLRQTCNGTLTLSCQSAITDTDNRDTGMIRVIDREPIPTCVAAPVAKLRLDLSKVHDTLQLALKGYADNQPGELGQGLSHFYGAVAPVQGDVNSVTAAKQACDVAVVGP